MVFIEQFEPAATLFENNSSISTSQICLHTRNSQAFYKLKYLGVMVS
jgi:hypothetical protein